MRIKKGEKLIVDSSNKGLYYAVAGKDFDTNKEEEYPVKLDQNQEIVGCISTWKKGDYIPCTVHASKIYRRKF